MAASVAGSLARWRTMKVKRMAEVSWPATRAFEHGVIDDLLLHRSAAAGRRRRLNRRLTRQLMGSSVGDDLPCSSRLAFFSLSSRSPRAAGAPSRSIALRPLRNAVNGR
ncbi:Os07g0519850 [Oryza sativa Japonica Group]|uniref:Os07g0519850 protein n=1 Tax=Oryza sativa subsp. japonica TaxID=39947 RepID=A0A0P0X6U5_ORYSJ|nr:Os07g0519850 [Oryza sativa Japonica Group]